jgi:hypothetical protein
VRRNDLPVGALNEATIGKAGERCSWSIRVSNYGVRVCLARCLLRCLGRPASPCFVRSSVLFVSFPRDVV